MHTTPLPELFSMTVLAFTTFCHLLSCVQSLGCSMFLTTVTQNHTQPTPWTPCPETGSEAPLPCQSHSDAILPKELTMFTNGLDRHAFRGSTTSRAVLAASQPASQLVRSAAPLPEQWWPVSQRASRTEAPLPGQSGSNAILPQESTMFVNCLDRHSSPGSTTSRAVLAASQLA